MIGVAVSGIARDCGLSGGDLTTAYVAISAFVKSFRAMTRRRSIESPGAKARV
jgi:hypothetical protein